VAVVPANVTVITSLRPAGSAPCKLCACHAEYFANLTVADGENCDNKRRT
jgi:hypothetical protein